MKVLLPLAVASVVLSSQAMAFGEVGRWSSGWGQGTAEYTVVDANKNQLYIACNDTDPATMTLTVAGKTYGSGAQKDFALIVDGKGPYYASDAGSNAGGDNFRAAWDGMRKAKTLQAKTADGKVVNLPLTGAAKALPARNSKQYSCVSW